MNDHSSNMLVSPMTAHQGIRGPQSLSMCAAELGLHNGPYIVSAEGLDDLLESRQQKADLIDLGPLSVSEFNHEVRASPIWSATPPTGHRPKQKQA